MCDHSILLDEDSFIPYYLRGFCKILNREEGLNDFMKSLEKINLEIKSYSFLFGKLKSSNISTDFASYQFNILNNIKIHIIEQNIKDYKNLKASDLKITKKNMMICFHMDIIVMMKMMKTMIGKFQYI